MKFVIAADSFKGALDASPFCDAVEAGIRRRLPDAQVCKLPLADGGEGTVHAVCRALGGSVNKEKAIDPFGNSIDSYIGFCHRGKTAVIDTGCGKLARHSQIIPVIFQRRNIQRFDIRNRTSDPPCA